MCLSLVCVLETIADTCLLVCPICAFTAHLAGVNHRLSAFGRAAEVSIWFEYWGCCGFWLENWGVVCRIIVVCTGVDECLILNSATDMH